MSTSPRGRQTPSQRQVIDLTRDSPEPNGTVLTPQRKRPIPQSHSSTSTNGSSTPSLFDEEVQDTPMTPGTPVEDLELSRDPFIETPNSTSLPPPLRRPSREITPTKKRASTKNTTRETGSQVARSRRQHTRSVSSTTIPENLDSIVGDGNYLLPCPPQTPVSRRASSGPTTSSSRRTSHRRGEAPDSGVYYPLIPGQSELANSHIQLQDYAHTTDTTPITTCSIEPGEETGTDYLSDQPSLHLSDPDDGFQRPTFKKYVLEKERVPLSDRAANNKIYDFLEGKLKSKAKSKFKDPKYEETGNAPPPKHKTLKPGWVYVHESVHAPSHVKIGKTKNEPSKRQKQLEKCKMTLLEVEDMERNAFDYYGVVESLIKYELHRCRKEFKCIVCGSVHDEWFEIEKTKAVDHIAKWREWIRVQQPFDVTGVLTPYWRWKVAGLLRTLNDVQWDVWRNPDQHDYWIYLQETYGNKYYFFLKDHLFRKDLRFCIVGMFILLLLDIWCGRLAVIWGVLGLIAL
jgi:hypothetical protein